MPPIKGTSWRTALLASGALLLIATAIYAWFKRGHTGNAPEDCALTASARHEGTFQHWRLSMAPGEGMSGEVSAVVRLTDGRDIIAYNVTNAAGLSAGDKVSIAEIQCIHRRIFLLQSGGS